MKICDRLLAATPPFFRRLRAFGVAVAAVGSAVLTVPVGVTGSVAEVAGYLIVAGGVISAVSQLAVEDDV